MTRDAAAYDLFAGLDDEPEVNAPEPVKADADACGNDGANDNEPYVEPEVLTDVDGPTMQLVPRDTIERIVAARDKALVMFAEAHTAIALANDAVMAARAQAMRAYLGDVNAFTHDSQKEVAAFMGAVQMPPRDQYIRTARKVVDRAVWAHLVAFTELERLMDKQAKEELAAQMRYVPDKVDRDGQLITEEEIAKGLPEVTVDNVYATLEHFRGSADLIFRRGIANAFAKLDRRFRSHDGFKIGSRIILNHAFNESGSWSYYGDLRATLIDIERTFAILDGKFDAATFSTTIGIIDQERRKFWNAAQSEHDTPYFKIRIYKNGNAHLWMVRKDLAAKVNRILADYYGEVIADGMTKEADPFANPKTLPAKRYGYFPTPTALAEDIVGRLSFVRKAGSPPVRVLEPQAGGGALARACVRDDERRRWAGDMAKEYQRHVLVDCVEIQPHLCAELEAEGIYNRVICGDFLAQRPDPSYDVIVMNPPFDLERDIDHVWHALKFLKPGGMLVSIMSAGTEFRETKKAQAFREHIAKLNGVWRDLPPGSFAEMGTNVNTIALTVKANGDQPDWEHRRP